MTEFTWEADKCMPHNACLYFWGRKDKVKIMCNLLQSVSFVSVGSVVTVSAASDLEIYLSQEISSKEFACLRCPGGRPEDIMFHRQYEMTEGDSTESSVYQLEI